MSPDDLVRVAGGRHQPEAEFIQGLLRDAGIPALVRRAQGFDVPEMLAAGQRDVLVTESRADEARALLEQAGYVARDASGEGPDPVRLLAGVVGAVIAVAAIVAALDLLLRG